jgi:hypothetical protein
MLNLVVRRETAKLEKVKVKTIRAENSVLPHPKLYLTKGDTSDNPTWCINLRQSPYPSFCPFSKEQE